MDTKVRVFGTSLGVGKGELRAERVRESLKGSLNRLRVDRVRVLFAHRPDAEVPVGEIAGGFGAMESDGWCEMVSKVTLSDVQSYIGQSLFADLMISGAYGAFLRTRSEIC